MSSRFLELPAELRNQIYELAFSKRPCKAHPDRESGEQFYIDLPTTGHPLLQVNRQIRNETLALYYSTYTFSFDCDWRKFDEKTFLIIDEAEDKKKVALVVKNLISWLKNMGEVGRENLRGMEMHFGSSWDNLCSVEQKMREEMKGHDLEKFRPTYRWNCWHGFGSEGVNEHGDSCNLLIWPRENKNGLW